MVDIGSDILHYKIVGLRGTGASGSVYEVEEKRSGDRFAMKVISRELLEDPVFYQRYQRETESMFRINLGHPNLIQLIETVETEETAGYVMELADSGTLDDYLGGNYHFDWGHIATILIHSLKGLNVLHGLGVIHRDIKPTNLLLSSDGSIKISDFGASFLRESQSITRKGDVVGSLQYTAPEYLVAGNFDTRSDLYSLGVIGYELITGVRLFQGMNLLQLVDAKANCIIQPPRDVVIDCPEVLSMVVEKSLASNPDHRFQSAAEILSVFESSW